jgi:hypothetical protein
MQDESVEVVRPVDAIWESPLLCSGRYREAVCSEGSRQAATFIGRICSATSSTQWLYDDRPGLTPRVMTAEILREIPPPPDVGDDMYLSVQGKYYAWREGVGMPTPPEAMP